MAGNIENLTAPRWVKGQSGNPKGRPKNRVREFREKILGKKNAKAYYGIGAQEMAEWYETLLTLDVPALKALAKDDTAPALARTYARAIIIEMGSGKTYTVGGLSDKLYGKAVQRVEHTGADGSDLFSARTLTKEEAAELMKELDNEC